VATAAALAGCALPGAAPQPACPHQPATAATPAQLWPCARDAAAAWRPGAELYAVEGAAGIANGTPAPADERPLDGAAPQWGFTFADLAARTSATFVVEANGSLNASLHFSWRPGEKPAPHPDGYQDPLPVSFLDAWRLHGAALDNATTAPWADRDAYHAYSLVSVAGKRPAWLVISGGSPDALYAEFDPATWTVVGARLVPD
jgi:hypothetical protein